MTLSSNVEGVRVVRFSNHVFARVIKNCRSLPDISIGQESQPQKAILAAVAIDMKPVSIALIF
jgi:hypothetical protein